MSDVAGKPSLRYVVLDCRTIDALDYTAVDGLERLVGELHTRGIRVLLTHTKLPIRRSLENAGWEEKFGGHVLYATTRDALKAVGLLQRRQPGRGAAGAGRRDRQG